jgi:hypothetical protein
MPELETMQPVQMSPWPSLLSAATVVRIQRGKKCEEDGDAG